MQGQYQLMRSHIAISVTNLLKYFHKQMQKVTASNKPPPLIILALLPLSIIQQLKGQCLSQQGRGRVSFHWLHVLLVVQYFNITQANVPNRN